MTRRPLISGTPLVGFNSLFDAAYGSTKGSKPHPRVTPSRVGAALLPFPCPHCGEVRPVVVDRKRYAGYRDPVRGHSWCPACRGRYEINFDGAPLVGALEPGAISAPAIVEVGGKKKIVRERVDGFSLLGTT